MKASKVIRVLEKKTIKECVKKYIVVESYSGTHSKYRSFQTKDSMYDEIRKDMADFVAVSRCLSFDLFGCRIKMSYGDASQRTELYFVHITDVGVFTKIEKMNDEITDPNEEEAKETLGLVDLIRDLNEADQEKARDMWYNTKLERIIRGWFDADGKLVKGKEYITLDTKYSIDDDVLMNEVKKQIDVMLLGKDKNITWTAELIEDSLVHYEFPMLSASMVSGGDITSGEMKDLKMFDLTEDLKAYEPHSFTIFEEREPLDKIDKDFKKHLIMTCAFGAAHFVLFLCMFAHWLFVPLYLAAIAATVFFGVKAFSESSKGKKKIELQKNVQDRIEKAIETCFDEIAEEMTNKVVIGYKRIEKGA